MVPDVLLRESKGYILFDYPIPFKREGRNLKQFNF